MALSNHERVGKALEILKAGLPAFVERELKSAHGTKWVATARQILGPGIQLAGTEQSPEWDAAGLLRVMWECWNDVFAKTLGRAERSIVSELMEIRNKWAHQKPFSTDDAYRALDSIHRLLNAVGAGKEAEDLDRQKSELMRVKFDEQARHERRKAQPTLGLESGGATGLKPWREVVTPHPDVASGRYQQAEFAADLWQVYRGSFSPEIRKTVSDEYADAQEFFRRTFLTVGLKDLLVRAVRRMASDGSDPVVELQTNFGGGKTHSMLALWHLFSGRPVAELPGIDAVIAEAKAGLPEQVRRVVLVGNKISPGQPVKKDDGTVVRTLWGELAWQLGGKEGFALVKQSDETATNPGDALGKLLRKYSPCLILIDEWVAYARGLHDTKDLPAGDFETQFTFAQTLTEEVKGVPGTMLVVSLPASADGGGGVSPTSDANDEEVGGVRGRMALAALRNVVSLVATAWRPANAEESFEIVRRRLFQPLPEPNYASRDNTAKAFCDLYRSNHQEFPPECRETDYERKLKAAYPIHPEIFDRLYQDWSALVKFQRTRGVLRLMAAVIHQLWESNDRSPLILPASIPLDDPGIVSQLTSYLPGGWETVIEKDVDGADALPRKLDSEKPNLGRFSACRRVARTLFLGSAPIPGAANRGEEDRRIKLGCVLPGEAPAVFGDALRHLAQAATYLYQDNARYWYATQPTVTKLADDRAEQLRREPDRVWEEIRRRVREDLRSRGEFPKIQPFPNSSGDVPDEMEVRLVVLDVEKPYAKEGTNHALEAAKEVLVQRGNSPRIYQNTLVFLAADRSRLDELEQAARYYLAWHSITEQETELNLDKSQSKQAATQKGTWDRTTTSRIGETYQWLLVPTQPGPQSALEWQQTRLTGADALAARASKKLRNDGQMVAQFAATFLRQALDVIPLWRGNHVAVKQLIEDFARYPYLQRLRDGDVLLSAMREGVSSVTGRTDTFAFAEAFDEAKGRYLGLRGGQVLAFGSDAIGLLVKSATADAQIESDRPKLPAKPVGAGADTPGAAQPVGGSTPAIPAPGGGSTQVSPTPTHFFGSVKVDVARISRDVGTIANEIIQHLASLPNSEIIVTLEIQARVPGGVPDNVVRTVSENCRTLKFKSQSFERE